MKTLFLQLAALPLLAQTNAIQLCDQQTPKHCLTLKAPSTMTLSPTPVVLSGNSGALLVGLASTDLSILAGSVVSADAFVSVSAAANASVMSMAATPSSGGADISVSKTGSGALLPLRFWRNPTEVARFDVSNRFLVGLTGSDVGSGLGAVIAGDAFISATAAADASLGSLGAVAGTYVALSSSKTGSGTYLPLTFFTSATERMRVLTGGSVLVGATADDGSSSLFQVAGKVSASTGYRANGNLGGTAVLTVRNSAGTGTCTITFSGGLFIASTC